MTNITKKTEALNKDVEVLQKTVQSNWIGSAVTIYEFAKKHNKAELTAWLNEKGLKVTEKANKFTATAKIAVAEEVDGVWTVNDAQASRYSKVCLSLDEEGVPVEEASKFLEGKTMTSIIRPTNKGNGDKTASEKLYQMGLTELEEEYGDLIRFESDKFFISSKSGLVQGPNLAVVVVGEDFEVQSIARTAETGEALKVAVRKIASNAKAA